MQAHLDLLGSCAAEWCATARPFLNGRFCAEGLICNHLVLGKHSSRRCSMLDDCALLCVYLVGMLSVACHSLCRFLHLAQGAQGGRV